MTKKKLWFMFNLYGYPREEVVETVRTRRRILLGDTVGLLLGELDTTVDEFVVVGMGWEFGEFVITLKER